LHAPNGRLRPVWETEATVGWRVCGRLRAHAMRPHAPIHAPYFNQTGLYGDTPLQIDVVARV